MLKFLLDTNTCIYIINKRPPQVEAVFRRYRTGEIGASSITVAELAYGVTKSGSARNRAALEHFLLELELMPFDEAAAWHYGDLRTTVEKRGTPIGALDQQIAAHALVLGVTLVTNNVREFERVEGLKVENWF